MEVYARIIIPKYMNIASTTTTKKPIETNLTSVSSIYSKHPFLV